MNSNKAPNTPKVVPKTSHTCMCHVVVVIRFVPRILEMGHSRGPPFIYLANIYTTTMRFQKELDSNLKRLCHQGKGQGNLQIFIFGMIFQPYKNMV